MLQQKKQLHEDKDDAGKQLLGPPQDDHGGKGAPKDEPDPPKGSLDGEINPMWMNPSWRSSGAVANFPNPSSPCRNDVNNYNGADFSAADEPLSPQISIFRALGLKLGFSPLS